MKRALLAAVLMALFAGCEEEEAPATPSARATPPPAASSPAAPLPPTLPPTNQPPVLGLKIAPDPPDGVVPHTVKVNMCQSSDPDGDRLIFEFKWGGGAKHFSFFCRDEHTYTQAGRYKAFFCVSDRKAPMVCQNHLIDVR